MSKKNKKRNNMAKVRAQRQEIVDSLMNGLFQGDNIVAKTSDATPGGLSMQACAAIEEIITRAANDISHAYKITDPTDG